MKVGIVGAAGYSGEVLVKILLGHPQARLAAVTSRTHAGKPLAQVMPALRGRTRASSSPSPIRPPLAKSDLDLFFLALPHGAAATYAKALVAGGKRVIDLSADFRITRLETYQKYYGEHHAPELLPQARFVLPELTPPAWRTEAKLIAVPRLLSDEHPRPARAAAPGRPRVPEPHRGQFLQRRQRRRPEGGGALSLRASGPRAPRPTA